MPWRPALDDRVRRYLRQQIELGGPDVVLGPELLAAEGASPLTRLARESASGGEAGGGGRPTTAGRRQDAAPSPDPGPGRPVRAARPGRPDWRTGAPPIPGPGITVPVPATDLLAPAAPPWPSLEAVAAEVAACRRCFLAEGRRNTVPGEGNPGARLVLVGEGPGQTEDETGRPFVGRAGELLTEILRAIELEREDVFICNVVKCRPPQNRKPLPDECAACLPYLEAQLDLIRPKVIVALGATAAEALLNVRRSLSDLRGKVHSYRGVPLIVTYHPAALLRNPNWKKPTWDDVRVARQLVDR